MGRPMCQNLLKSGQDVVVCDTNEEVLKEFQSMGAEVVTSPAALARSAGVETVISMLPSAAHVERVFGGEDGILSVGAGELQPKFFIDCSSTGPQCSLNMQQQLGQSGDLTFVDAPVSGGVPGAEAATLTFMVGAPSEEIFERVQAVLVPTVGKQAVHCGTTGAGQSTKLCNNLVLGITMAGVSEAMALGQKLGLDPENLSRVFNSSSAQCWSTSLYNPCPGVMPGVPSSRDYENGFLTELMIKDLTSAQQAAEGAKADIFLGKLANDLYQKMQSDHQRKDFSAIYRFIYGGKACSGDN
ncbi:3-hydroxyisobutyrate dehydrogenase [Chloropicon primus]|uniref:3-hydroxyisobutyrate dehydrogenase n=1 Tax=Chloropicon primus TaxID=1764295 RepID=A0A5B8MRH3_9CHLO|nr:3-hydroxyisobutyrate dehydrogenase [Chloropicon primus]|eukprot:QDZ23053.1 3-hydroxyisobutyrate dehydrogenase [Chloropicon primus]